MIYKNPKASLKGGKKWRFQCASWEVGCLAFVFFFFFNLVSSSVTVTVFCEKCDNEVERAAGQNSMSEDVE